MTAMNHEGESFPIWPKLKAKLKILLSAPQVLSAAFDAGVAENVAAEKRFFQEIKDSIADRRLASGQTPAQQTEETN